MKKYIKILLKSKLFFAFSEERAEKIIETLSPNIKHYKKNEYIFNTGDKITCMGVMLDGSANIIKEDFWGNSTILSNLSAEQIFGEAFACSDSQKIGVSVLATADSTIMFFDIKSIINSELNKNLISVLAQKNVMLNRKIEYIANRKLRDKILSYLSDVSKAKGTSEFDIPFNRQGLADFLVADRSALSNELCKLRDEGILQFNKNHFKLL